MVRTAARKIISASCEVLLLSLLFQIIMIISTAINLKKGIKINGDNNNKSKNAKSI